MTKKCKVTQESPFVFRITLIQGLNRQIRRMCEHFGFEVTKLERVRIMNISLKGLPVGEWRELTPEEETDIYNLVAKSSSAADKTPKRVVKKAATAKEDADLVNVTPKKTTSRARPAGPAKGKAPSARSASGRAGKAEGAERPSKAAASKAGGSASYKPAGPSSDWNKSNGPSRRSVRPSNGKSGAPAGKTRSPKR